MRICVFGAGAIGGHLAGRLHQGGAEVSVVARGPHLAAIQSGGLHVHAPDGAIHARVAASDDPASLGVQDAVVVTAKAPSLPSVAAGIAPLLGPATQVAFVLNGIPWWYFDRHGGPLEGTLLPTLDPGDAVRRAVGPERTLGGVIYSACEVTAPGVVEVEHDRNRLVLGAPDGAVTDAMEALAAPLRAGGIRVDVVANPRDWIWTKLLMNLSSGPFAVLGQSAPKGVYQEPAMLTAARAIIAEGQAVAEALGCTIQVDLEKQFALSQSMTHKPSILQDLERGRPMEIDAIFDAPLRLARLAGVPTPTLDLVVALAKVRARSAGLYAG